MAVLSHEWNPLVSSSPSGARPDFYAQSLIGARRRMNRVAALEYEAAFQRRLLERLEEIVYAIQDLPPDTSALDALFHARVVIIAFAPRSPETDHPELPPENLWNKQTKFPTWTSKLMAILQSVREAYMEKRPRARTLGALNREFLRHIDTVQGIVETIQNELVELREIQEIQDRPRKPFINLLDRNRFHGERHIAVLGTVAGPSTDAAAKKNPKVHPNMGVDGEARHDLAGLATFDPGSDADESANTDDSASDEEILTLVELFRRGRDEGAGRQPRPTKRRIPALHPDARKRVNAGPRPSLRDLLRAADWERERAMIGEPPQPEDMNPQPDDPLAVKKRHGLYYPTYCGHRFSLIAHAALTLAQVKDDCYEESQRIVMKNPKLTETTEAEEVILVEALCMIVKQRHTNIVQQFIHHATLLQQIREADREGIPLLFENMPDLNSGIRRRFQGIANDTYEILRDIARRFKDELEAEFDENAVPLTDQPWMEEGAVIRRPLPMDLGFDIDMDLVEERENIVDENTGDQNKGGEQQGEGSNSRQDEAGDGKGQNEQDAEHSASRDKGKGNERRDKGDDKDKGDEKDKGKSKVIAEDADDEKEEGSDGDEDENEDESEEVTVDCKGKAKVVEHIDYKGKGRAVETTDYQGKRKTVETSDHKGRGKVIDEAEGDGDDGECADREEELPEDPVIGKIIGNVGELDIKGKGRAVVPSRPKEEASREAAQASGNVIDGRPGRWAGQVVQIYPIQGGAVLQFPVPPSDSTDEATQWARNFFESVPFELQDAVATGSLHRINRELSLFGVRDAIDYVSLLQEAGCIDHRATQLDIASVSKRRS